MKLYDVYVNKNNKNIIQIDSFADHINNSNLIVVFRNIEKHNEFEVGSCPSFNGYGTVEEIEKEYKLLIPADDLKNYKSWNEIQDLVNRSC